MTGIKGINCLLSLLLLLLLLFSAGCSIGNYNSQGNNKDNANSMSSQTGIKVSEWYLNKRYGGDVIDIINFDDRNRTVRVTTFCFDENNNTMPSNDSEIIKLPAKSQWTWIPLCPKNVDSYTIDVEELD